MSGFPPNLFTGTIGAVYMANTFSTLALGFVLTIAWLYFDRFGLKDPWICKSAVIIGVTGSIVESICVLGWGYIWCVQNYGNPIALEHLPFYFSISAIAAGTTTLANHIFYAWRVRILSKRMYLSCAIIFFSSYQFCYECFWLAPLLFRHPLTEELKKTQPSAYASQAATIAPDIIITASMVWYLIIKPRSDAGQRLPSHSLFKRIVLRTVQFNSLSLAIQVTDMILGIPRGVTFWFLIPITLICKTYAASETDYSLLHNG